MTVRSTVRSVPPWIGGPVLFALCLGLCGCGNTLSRTASEQLITSDAVDNVVAQIDFTPLSGKTVYFDTQYIGNVKGIGFVNAEYIISSLRQQLVASRCLLRDKKDEAELIVEGRVGALGTDAHEVTYGMPANNLLNTAATLVPGAPPVPSLPEMALAKRNDQVGAAKIGLFAYERDTGEPYWQSGVRQFRSTAKDVWLFGAGPFQSGTIYRERGTRFAGSKLWYPLGKAKESEKPKPAVDYHKRAIFRSACGHAACGAAAPADEPAEAAPEASGPEAKPDDQESKDGGNDSGQSGEKPPTSAEKPADKPTDKPAKIDRATDRHLQLELELIPGAGQ